MPGILSTDPTETRNQGGNPEKDGRSDAAAAGETRRGKTAEMTAAIVPIVTADQVATTGTTERRRQKRARQNLHWPVP
jgi:hypothetical protein